MGKGKKWSHQENIDLAEAWITVSEDQGNSRVNGVSQNLDRVFERVTDIMEKKAPARPDGTYHERGAKALKNHWSENIKRDVRKFNTYLRKVYNSKPTGVTEQQKINMAVAIMLGKVDAMSYRHKDFEAREWRYYGCWEVLKSHRGFLPPVDPSLNNTEEDDESVEDEVQQNGDDVARVAEDDGQDENRNATTTTTTTTTITTPKGNRNAVDESSAERRRKEKSRGGRGRKCTKDNNSVVEYRKKRLEGQEEAMALARKRAKAFKVLTQNDAATKAFRMAKDRYLIARDEDNQNDMKKYKIKMDEAMGVLNEDSSEDEDSTGSS